MPGEVRREVLDRARGAYVEMRARHEAEFVRLVDDLGLNGAEMLRLAVDLADASVDELKITGALDEPRSPLELDLHQVKHLAGQGYAFAWLADQLWPSWGSRPDTPLSTILKTERPDRVAWIARELRSVGLHFLDELSPPSVLNPNDVEDDDG